MTPDMKRLCEAAWCQMPVVDGVVISDTEPYPLCEAIVRAVLTELREVSGETADAGRWPAEDDGPVACLRAMIDHILAEPATA